MRDAVEWALSRGTKIVVTTQRVRVDRHVEQQTDLAAMLDARFPSRPGLRYVNLGKVVDLTDRNVAYDRIHLVAAGNDRIAEHLVDPILELAR